MELDGCPPPPHPSPGLTSEFIVLMNPLTQQEGYEKTLIRLSSKLYLKKNPIFFTFYFLYYYHVTACNLFNLYFDNILSMSKSPQTSDEQITQKNTQKQQ